MTVSPRTSPSGVVTIGGEGELVCDCTAEGKSNRQDSNESIQVGVQKLSEIMLATDTSTCCVIILDD